MKKPSKKEAKKTPRKTRKKVRRQQVPTVSAVEAEPGSGAQIIEAQPVLELAIQEMTRVLEWHDESSLARAKTHWFFGEWHQLAALEMTSLHAHPDRDRLALLVASAHQQLGKHDKAREYTRMALDWGCPARVVAQVLIAGVHNSLGRAAALQQDESRIARHFKASVAAIGTRDTALVSHVRSVREMARIGLLPQAATLVDRQLQGAREPTQSLRQQEAHFEVLKTEIELLRNELLLAQRRRQLCPSAAADDQTLPSVDPDDPEWLAGLKKRAVSQLGQELWVLEQTGYKRDGFFVEFGATDGVLSSNTWLLEKEFAWRGICAEPNPKFFDELARSRDCMISNACIGAKTGERVEFVFADVYGSMRQHLNQDKHGDKRAAYLDIRGSATLETISLHDFLKQHGAPHDIDYMSIDTEGSEYEILQSFPFDQWSIRLMTIEHNHSDQRASIRALMKRHGYQCMETKWDDWFSKER